MPHGFDCRAANDVAAADRERKTVTCKTGAIRVQNDIGGRIVGIRVHCVRAVEAPRSREAQVEGTEIGDAGHKHILSRSLTACASSAAGTRTASIQSSKSNKLRRRSQDS